MSESVPPIATTTDATPMPELTVAEQELWSHFAAALASRNLSPDDSATQLLRALVHRAQNADQLTSLADELQKEGPGVIDAAKVNNALRRWCPRAPFC